MLHVVGPLVAAGALPFVMTAVAKVGRFRARDNHVTRAWQEGLSGWRQRAHWAHLNGFETYPYFVAAVLVAHLAHPGDPTAAWLAWGYPVTRAAYSACYVADLAALRSLAWFASMVLVAALLLRAL